MGAVTRRFLALLNATCEIAADKVDVKTGKLLLPHGIIIATITLLPVDQTLTVETQV
jgi:hypothetical protein